MTSAVSETDTVSRGPLRADARRNMTTLLEVALVVFTELGVDAPVRIIAERAGVGVGTVYRHFPTRADLIVAVCKHEVDACAAAAELLQSAHPPLEALTLWVDRYAQLIAAKRGLGTALHSGDKAYDGLPAYFEKRMTPVLDGLLDAAAAVGEIRTDISGYDLLWAIAALCGPRRVGHPGLTRRMIALLLDGLRVLPRSPA